MAETVDKQRTDYTEGPIVASILKMGLPSMIGFLAQNIYLMADMFWVSRLPEGEAAVAAITFFNSLMWILFSFNSMAGPGSVAVISRRYGEKEYDRAEKAIKETLVIKLFFGSLLGLAGIIFMRPILVILGAEGETLRMGVNYSRIMLVGLPIMYSTYSVYTALRGVANPHQAMTLMVGSNILNIVLAPLFVFGWLGFPAWGIEGAGFAAVLSFSITFAVGLGLLYGGFANVRLHWRGKEKMTLEAMWTIIRIGLPAWVGEISFSLARMVITPLIASFGTAIVAAYGIGLQVFSFGQMMLVGMGLGLSSLTGHNLGSGKQERARKTADHAILLGVVVMAVFGAATFVFARPIMSVFFEHPETIKAGVTLLRISALTMPFFGALIMNEGIHSGIGLNMPVMVISILHSWVFQTLPVVICTRVLGLSELSVWWTLALSGVVSSTIFYLYYRRGKWLTVRV